MNVTLYIVVIYCEDGPHTTKGSRVAAVKLEEAEAHSWAARYNRLCEGVPSCAKIVRRVVSVPKSRRKIVVLLNKP